MTGIIVTFSLDLLSIPCYVLAKGDYAALNLYVTIGETPIQLSLTSIAAPSIQSADGSSRRFLYNKVSISITLQNEDLANNEFIEGRAHALLGELQAVVLDVLNRLITYFKYEKRQPHLRELTYLDFVKEASFFNPMWQTLEGIPLTVSGSPFSSGVISIPGIGLLRDDFFGISLFTADESLDLQRWLS